MDDSDLDENLRGDRPACVISGGQTGADRGALIAAAVLGYRHGGFVPKGRLAEDGRVPDGFLMEELETADYPTRTRANIEYADATLVFTYGMMTPGTSLTLKTLQELGKPSLHVTLPRSGAKDVEQLRKAATGVRGWIREQRPRILNVAGSRESKAPGIEEHVAEIMLRSLRTKDWCLCGRAIPAPLWVDAERRDVPIVCSECGYHNLWRDFE